VIDWRRAGGSDLLAAAGVSHLVDRVYPTADDGVRANANRPQSPDES
jgi:hypothetical protein